MSPFWTLARRMLRYRSTVAGAMVFATLSAGSLGAGLVGIVPILERILAPKPSGDAPAPIPDLPGLAAEWNAKSALDIPDWVIDTLPAGQFNAVLWMVVALGLLTVFGGFANFMHAYLSLTAVQRTVANVRREAFHRVIRLPLKDVVAGGATDKLSRIVNDTATLESGLTALLSKALSQTLKGVAAFAAALVVEWKVTAAALIVAPVMYAVIRKLGKRIRRASRSALQSQAGLYAAALEALQGLRVVKVHTTERYEAGRFHRVNKEVMRQMLRVRTARAIASPLTEVLAIIALGTLSLVTARQIIDQTISPASFLTALGCLFAAGASLKPLTGLVNDIQVASAAADRLADIMRLDPEPGHDARMPKLPRHAESLRFEGVTFTYPGAAGPALRSVTLDIRHGERVAIVGPNGSGKTTLLSLVPRLFEPDENGGRVLVDGRDIREFSVRSLRRQIGVVTQETVIFRGTIRANIAYGAENATDARVVAAAEAARATDFIRALPQGLDTPVGEQGLTLSGGQRQRVAIARAILRDPAILILDEATSMIDADSEAKIVAALADFSRGRTSLIVAHRLSTVLGADRIVVMDQGRVVDQGSHADLLSRCATYRVIAERQLLGGGDAGPQESTA